MLLYNIGLTTVFVGFLYSFAPILRRDYAKSISGSPQLPLAGNVASHALMPSLKHFIICV